MDMLLQGCYQCGVWGMFFLQDDKSFYYFCMQGIFYVDYGGDLYCWMVYQVFFDWSGVDVIVGIGDDVIIVVQVVDVVGFVYVVQVFCEQEIVCEFFVCCFFIVLVVQEYYWIWCMDGDIVDFVVWQDGIFFIDDLYIVFWYCVFYVV